MPLIQIRWEHEISTFLYSTFYFSRILNPFKNNPINSSLVKFFYAIFNLIEILRNVWLTAYNNALVRRYFPCSIKPFSKSTRAFLKVIIAITSCRELYNTITLLNQRKIRLLRYYFILRTDNKRIFCLCENL